MNIDDLEYYLHNAITGVGSKRNQLIIVLEKEKLFEQVLAQMGIKLVNINLALSKQLVEVPENKRARMVRKFIDDIVRANDQDILAFEHIELLFLPQLQQEPARLFEYLSRERTVILLWPGKYEGGNLYYAEPWHREYKEYNSFDAVIIHDN